MALFSPFFHSVDPFRHVLSQFFMACHYVGKHATHIIGRSQHWGKTWRRWGHLRLQPGARWCTTFLCAHIISLSNVEDVPIIIPSDIVLDGEFDIAFLLFSCLGLGVKSVSECISPGWSKTEDNPSDRSGAMRSSYIVLKLFLAFELIALPWDCC